MDLRPFFSVLTNTEDFDDTALMLENLIREGADKLEIESSIYSSESELEDWIEHSVSINVGPVQISTPAPTPTPTFAPTQTPRPEVVFAPLAERFETWRSNWVESYGGSPRSIHGEYGGDIKKHLPMCGVVRFYSGGRTTGFTPSRTIPLGTETIVLPGDHDLDFRDTRRRAYTVEVHLPTLHEIETVTTEYNEQLRRFLEECGG